MSYTNALFAPHTAYGVLGVYNCICILICIVKFNQSIPAKMVDTQATDLQEELTLLMTMMLESEENRNEVNSGCTDATNASYEEIEEEASLKHVDFDIGKNINYLSISVTTILAMNMCISMYWVHQ